MSDFVYREHAVRSLSLRQMLFPPESTYAWEFGGLPQSIEALTTAEVIDYHKEFYSYNNMTLILVGAYDECPAAIFNVLDSLDAEIVASPPALARLMPPIRSKLEKRRTDVLFASEKSQTGTMAFAWEGPPAEDIETQVALEMLLDYFKADPASPLRKRFTNRPVPIAGDITVSLSAFIPTVIELSFTEVPFSSYVSHAAAAAAEPAKRRNAYASMSYPSPADAFGPLDLAKLHDDINGLFGSNYYRKQLVSTLTYIVEHWLPEHWLHFNSYLAKRRLCISTKFAEVAMEQRGHMCIINMLSHDAVVHRLSPGGASSSQPAFASRGHQFSMRRALEKKDCAFWKELIQKWFLDAPMVHLAMIPDPKMGIQIEAERNLAQRNRVESMSPSELETTQQKLAEALESTKLNIPREAFATLPPIPDISRVQTPEYVGYNFGIGSDPLFSQSPFGTGRVLVLPNEVQSRFQFSLPLAGLPSELQPYLPLFARLLTAQAGLVIPHSFAATAQQDSCFPQLKPSGMPFAYVNSEQVDSAVSAAFTEYDSCIGDYFSHDTQGRWPIEVLTLYGLMQPKDMFRAFKLLVLKLLFGDFGVDVILKTATKMKKELKCMRGTGNSLLLDTFPWLRIPGSLDARTMLKHDSSVGGASSGVVISHQANEPLGKALNLYYQIAFLSTVTKSLSAAMSEDDLVTTETNNVSDAIMQIRAHFASSISPTGLAHVTLPGCLDRTEAHLTLSTLVGDWMLCSSAWREDRQPVTVPTTPYEPSVIYSSGRRIYTPPRKRRRAVAAVQTKASIMNSPNSRVGSCEFVAVSPSMGIHIALANLQTSYVGIQIPLRIQRDPSDTQLTPVAKQLETRPAKDYYSLQLLCTIFNRCEGMVKNAIRGPGYAYGIAIHPRPDEGHIAMYISHAVDPHKALHAFWQVMEHIGTENGWAEAVDEFQLNAARSNHLLRLYMDISQSLMFEDAIALFRGYADVDQQLLWVRTHIDCVSVADLRQAFLKHFVPFITKGANSLSVFATPQYSPETGTEFLHQLNGNVYGIQFKAVDMSVLDPVVNI
ncbi:hypothetical protein GGI04_001764 [Coemansia thaxteri]|nr:hypothetical protein GGI04_001764 [Coemansia thaxteri]